MSQLEFLEQDAMQGCCIACDERLPPAAPGRPGRKRQKLCGKDDCLRLYQCLWSRDARARKRQPNAEAI